MTPAEFDDYARKATEPAPVPMTFALVVAAVFVAVAWLLLTVGLW